MRLLCCLKSAAVLPGVLAALLAIFAPPLDYPEGPRKLAVQSYVVLHNGGIPENTIAGMRTALKVQKRLTGVEVDIRPTADGDLVAMHDSTFLRTTNGTVQEGESATLLELPASRVLGLSAGCISLRRGDPVVCCEPPADGELLVPRLADVVRFATENNLFLVIELKRKLSGRALQRFRESFSVDLARQSVVISFYPHALYSLRRELGPTLQMALLSAPGILTSACRDGFFRSRLFCALTPVLDPLLQVSTAPWLLKHIGADGAAIRFVGDETRGHVERLRNSGFWVLIWGVKQFPEAAHYLAPGVSLIVDGGAII